MLQLGTCTHTALTPDALAVILEEGWRGAVYRIGMIFNQVKEYMLSERILIRQGLKLALLILVALGAVCPVL